MSYSLERRIILILRQQWLRVSIESYLLPRAEARHDEAVLKMTRSCGREERDEGGTDIK
jgi:hypothetical protein